MEIQAISPAVQNKTAFNKTAHHKVAFQGALGDKFVSQLVSGSEVKPAKVIEEMKGMFGYNGGKIEDVLESFIGKIQDLLKGKSELEGRLANANERIRQFPERQRVAVNDAIETTTSRFEQIISAKDAEIAGLKTETEAAKEAKLAAEQAKQAAEESAAASRAEAAKYEPVYKLKPMEEGVITPERAIQLFDEIFKNQSKAEESLANLMKHGKGHEEALAQLERYAILKDITNTRSENFLMSNQMVISAYNRSDLAYKLDLGFSPDFFKLLQDTIRNNSDLCERLKTPAIRKQAAQNLAAIAKPNGFVWEKQLTRFNQRTGKYEEISVEEYLEERLQNMIR